MASRSALDTGSASRGITMAWEIGSQSLPPTSSSACRRVSEQKLVKQSKMLPAGRMRGRVNDSRTMTRTARPIPIGFDTRDINSSFTNAE